ncbi:hypothetical protein EJ08DRAFT_618944 [Tothia fuscella]|uniref:Uncharacterized protein n=1 Tax=Tothia fuscella TaxID=1048955 RepID=A0A9P4TV22_9PEZI|nr:hypothetical protein EJ08DRAFT_618944 [Tothia fuscella]
MSLALLRERGVSLADMVSLGPSIVLPREQPFEFNLPCWRPQIEIDDRIPAFTHRLLRDFNHQWRHILRSPYNSTTLRTLARAAIRISTLDFEVRANTRGYGSRISHVWITHLPPWEPFQTDIVRMGSVHVILSQTIQNGLLMAQRHLSEQTVGSAVNWKSIIHNEGRPDYIILSVRDIMLCQINGPNSLRHTAPEPLFNGNYGIEPPSKLALDYLVWAIASARITIPTPIQSLPVEIQDIILTYGSLGTVVAARLGCLLNIGSPFLWQDGSLTVALENNHVTRPSGSSVESLIWFDEHKSGLVYLARWE